MKYPSLCSTLPILSLVSFINFSFAESPPLATDKLELDKSYQVEWIGERPLIDSSYLSLTLVKKTGKAYGYAGCNYWYGSFQLDNNEISIQINGSTSRECAPSLMEQEERYLSALPKVERWDISETRQLRLWPSKGKPIRLWRENF